MAKEIARRGRDVSFVAAAMVLMRADRARRYG
jgi:hypothetical protein